MLYLVTLPPELHPGTYSCERVSHEVAASLIKNADEAGELKSFVNFASTKFAIKELSGVKVDVVQKISLPEPKEGDSYLHCRAGEKSSDGRIGLEQLQFFKIRFSATIR